MKQKTKQRAFQSLALLLTSGLVACTLTDRSYLQAKLNESTVTGGASSAAGAGGRSGGGGPAGTGGEISGVAGASGSGSLGGAGSGGAGPGPGGAGGAGGDGGAPDVLTGLRLHYAFDADSGTAVADSVADNDGVLSGNPTWISSGRLDGALRLDGDGDNVTLPENLLGGLSSLTLAIWVNFQNHTLNEEVFVFAASNQERLGLGLDISQYPVFVLQQSPLFETLEGTGYELPTEEWVHLAVTWDIPNGHLYVNGELAASNDEFELTPAANLRFTSTNFIGRSGSGEVYIEADIDDFRIYNRALTGKDVRALAAMGE